jgi:UDP-glucuronate 4-epimerase
VQLGITNLKEIIRMTRYFITGDAGFIGFHLARHLLADGAEVMGYDGMTEYYDPRLKRDRRALNEQYSTYTPVTGMLEDRELLKASVDRFEPEVVVHLAAQAGVRYSISNPDTYISSNILGTFNLLEIMRETKPRHLMLASTSSVYGGNTKMPFSEIDRADAPVSLYAATKRATEALAHSSAHLWGVPITAFRFFTVYGPWGRPDMALFKFVDAIEQGKEIDVYGHGQMRRDFTYVEDLVDAIVRLSDIPPTQIVSPADSKSPVAPYRTVNIAGGTPVELLEFIKEIERATGKTASRRLLPMQPGDVVETFSDCTLLNDLIGVVPSTPVRVGVERFTSWFREYYADTRAL